MNIKKFRRDYGLSQKALAGLLGVTEAYISYLERGLREPSEMLRLLFDYVAKEKKKKRR